MKILITGASGFFGRNLLDRLKNKKAKYDVAYSMHSTDFSIEGENFFKKRVDLHDEGDVRNLIKSFRPTHLVHLAWSVPPGGFWESDCNVRWIYSSFNLFKEFCENGGKVFIGAGSIAEYEWTSGILDEQLTPLNPGTLYGQCKKSLHEILCKYRNFHSIKTKIIWPRIGYFFGPGEPKEKLISKIVHNIKNNIPLDLVSPSFSRGYAHVKYLARAIEKCLIMDGDSDVTFNLSSSYLYPMSFVVECICRNLLSYKANVNYGSYISYPSALRVLTKNMLKMGIDIEDTFVTDIKEFIQGEF